MAWMFVLFAVSFLFPTSVPGSCEDSSSDVSTNGTADPFPAHGGMAPCCAVHHSGCLGSCREQDRTGHAGYMVQGSYLELMLVYRSLRVLYGVGAACHCSGILFNFMFIYVFTPSFCELLVVGSLSPYPTTIPSPTPAFFFFLPFYFFECCANR